MWETAQKMGSMSRGVESLRGRSSEPQKQRIVAENYRCGESISAVTRRHGVHTRRFGGVRVGQVARLDPCQELIVTVPRSRRVDRRAATFDAPRLRISTHRAQ